ncbi:MAG: carbamoyltransferase HypF [Vicinamibacterales bacterium]
MPERLRVALRGAVQGVGFRPFVYRIATTRQLRGWCRNSAQGFVIEVEGERPALESFRAALDRERPPRASIHGSESVWLDASGLGPFTILDSDDTGQPSAVVMPDIALCESCRGELLDPTNRRYRYPFINCTNCGPRYSIVEALPYDRAHTSMRHFPMCPDCHREYDDPHDRRFHAEPNACPTCGPQVALWDAAGRVIAERDAAMVAVANAVRAGLIVALKGIGGFQLIVDATDDAAVRRLRARKHRDEKPFALMCPDVDCMHGYSLIGDAEARLLNSPEAPIVLVRTREGVQRVAPSVAPGMRQLGVMLPYTPLHVLLMRDLRRPIVATSGNLAEEPMCIDERDVVRVLGGIADVFLVHDRPIVRAVDDSVVRVVAGRELMLRRARGYAPLPVLLPAEAPPLVAVGGHLKNTVSVTAGAGIVVSQHIGDLDSTASGEAFHTTLASLEHLYRVHPEAAVVDLHPDYQSTVYGRALGLQSTPVQHHYAHLMACMVDNDLRGDVVGAVWDGTGYGTDGTIWGGEVLRATASGFDRVACLRPFRLPGGDAAAREPRRSALAVLAALGEGALARWQTRRPDVFTDEEWRVLPQAIARGINAPVTTSMGRLLDAVACLVGLRDVMAFEGQAAMLLEQAADPFVQQPYPIVLRPAERAWYPGAWDAPPMVIDWAPMIRALITDVEHDVAVGVMAARVHLALAEALVQVATALGESRLLLTGGCSQNRVLTEAALAHLTDAGVKPYWHQRLPPNDGGISAGQIAARLRAHREADWGEEATRAVVADDGLAIAGSGTSGRNGAAMPGRRVPDDRAASSPASLMPGPWAVAWRAPEA